MTTRQNPPDNRPDHSAPRGRCKVCTKLVRTDEEHTNVFYGGQYHLMCCVSCAAKFEANPRQYLVS